MDDQPTLFDIAATVVTTCAQGRHAKLRDEPPQFLEGCVNIDHVCPLCELRVSSTSWTREAWDAKRAKIAGGMTHGS